MPRSISASEKLQLIDMLTKRDENGELVYGQRELERITEFSRPYIRKIAREVGVKFDRNGFEIKGQLCVCANCGCLFRRPASKIKRAKLQFCEDTCRVAFMRGPSHPNWKVGVSAKSFSEWVKNQKEYKEWKEAVIARAGYKCEISGRKENLDAHHLEFKSQSPEKAFDVENGIALNEEVHNRLHQLSSKGHSFEECLEILKKEFKNG